MTYFRTVIMIVLVLLPAACTTIHGITPISPKAGVDQTVDTLQPTFRWEPVDEPDGRYDFLIYESLGPPFHGLGEKVYYREGLQEPEHTLEVSLQPDRAYYWSVRMRRRGEEREVSEWSRFDYRRWKGAFPASRIITTKYPFFLFRTPDK